MNGKILEDETIASFLSNTTKSMLGEPSRLVSCALPSTDYSALLSLEGSDPFTIGISVCQHDLRQVGAAIFGEAIDRVDVKMMRDSLGELLNMTAGQIRNAIAKQTVLGLPEHVFFSDMYAAEGRIVTVSAGGPLLSLWIAEKPAALCKDEE